MHVGQPACRQTAVIAAPGPSASSRIPRALFYSRFHQPLHLNSAVRTVEYQLRLQRVNGNAAAVDGDGASPHLTGQAIDLGKRGMKHGADRLDACLPRSP